MIVSGSNLPTVQNERTPPTRYATAVMCSPATWKSGDDVAMRVDRALGPARGATRVEDDRGVVLRDRRVGQRGVEVVAPERIEVVLDDDRRHARVLTLEAGQPLGVGHQDPGIGVLDAVPDLRTDPPAVEPDGDGPEAYRRPEGHDPLGAVRREDRDPVTRTDAVAVSQRRGDGRERALVLLEGDDAPRVAVAEDQVLAVAEADRGHHGLPQVRHAVLEDRHALAEDVVLDHLEEATGRDQLRLDLRQPFGDTHRRVHRGRG